MKQYKHIFFDLDHTIWDFETNSQRALQHIFDAEGLAAFGVSNFEAFHQAYRPINDRYWARYHNNYVTKEQLRVGRFADTLAQFGVTDIELAERMAQSYLQLSPTMTALFPDAVEVLQYLQSKYALHLITNGFAEVQWVKVERSGLRPFFEHIIISEEVGTQKPDKQIFEIAMQRAGTTTHECIMIGDNFNTDIVGARNAGIDQVYFNPKKKRVKEPVTHTIYNLAELKHFL